MLVNARFMGKRVVADDCLIRRHRHTGYCGQKLAGSVDLTGINSGFSAVYICTGLNGHNDFLQRSVTRPLADTIDRTFNLISAALHSGQTVGNAHPQVVVAMHRKNCPVRMT